MTILDLPVRTAVRRAGLVDVPAVVRLFTAPDDPSVDWDRTQRALRLLLAHVALEEGQVWVAEGADGALLAAAVWLPPGARSPAERLDRLFARELGAPPTATLLPDALRVAAPGTPHWSVVTVCASRTAQDARRAAEGGSGANDGSFLVDLLAPGLREVDAEGGGVAALSLSRRQVDDLSTLGFSDPRPVEQAPCRGLWLSTRPAAHTTSAPETRDTASAPAEAASAEAAVQAA